jgi:GntR family transcriptional regulator
MTIEFDDEARVALAYAVEEAHALGHDFVEPEHLLLGLLRAGGAAATAVGRRGAPAGDVRADVLGELRPGTSTGGWGELPHASRSKRVLEDAAGAARRSGAAAVGGDHLLAALAAGDGAAAGVLERLGIVSGAGLPRAPRPGDAPRPLRIELDEGSAASLYDQIVARVQEAVATGTLRPGERLPPVRTLARQLALAPGTVARAYSELERRGVVVTRGARGTHVAERRRAALPGRGRPETLPGLLRPVAVAAFHLGATAAELRAALDEAMVDIYGEREG